MQKIITKRANGTKRVIFRNEKPSRVQAQFQKECDVNEILKKYKATGMLTHVAKTQIQYMDHTQLPDLHTAMIQLTTAQQAFDALPAELRKRFANSPAEMYEFLANPENNEEAVKLGLKVRIEQTGPIEKSAGNKGKARVSPTQNPETTPTKSKTASNDDD